MLTLQALFYFIVIKISSIATLPGYGTGSYSPTIFTSHVIDDSETKNNPQLSEETIESIPTFEDYRNAFNSYTFQNAGSYGRHPDQHSRIVFDSDSSNENEEDSQNRPSPDYSYTNAPSTNQRKVLIQYQNSTGSNSGEVINEKKQTNEHIKLNSPSQNYYESKINLPLNTGNTKTIFTNVPNGHGTIRHIKRNNITVEQNDAQRLYLDGNDGHKISKGSANFAILSAQHPYQENDSSLGQSLGVKSEKNISFHSTLQHHSMEPNSEEETEDHDQSNKRIVLKNISLNNHESKITVPLNVQNNKRIYTFGPGNEEQNIAFTMQKNNGNYNNHDTFIKNKNFAISPYRQSYQDNNQFRNFNISLQENDGSTKFHYSPSNNNEFNVEKLIPTLSESQFKSFLKLNRSKEQSIYESFNSEDEKLQNSPILSNLTISFINGKAIDSNKYKNNILTMKEYLDLYNNIKKEMAVTSNNDGRQNTHTETHTSFTDAKSPSFESENYSVSYAGNVRDTSDTYPNTKSIRTNNTYIFNPHTSHQNYSSGSFQEFSIPNIFHPEKEIISSKSEGLTNNGGDSRKNTVNIQQSETHTSVTDTKSPYYGFERESVFQANDMIQINPNISIPKLSTTENQFQLNSYTNRQNVSNDPLQQLVIPNNYYLDKENIQSATEELTQSGTNISASNFNSYSLNSPDNYNLDSYKQEAIYSNVELNNTANKEVHLDHVNQNFESSKHEADTHEATVVKNNDENSKINKKCRESSAIEIYDKRQESKISSMGGVGFFFLPETFVTSTNLEDSKGKKCDCNAKDSSNDESKGFVDTDKYKKTYSKHIKIIISSGYDSE